MRASDAVKVRVAPDVELEVLTTGAGDPVTVFAHGLAGGIADTRPLGSGVVGRRVFFQFRGHGASVGPPGAWTYEHLAADLRGIAAATGATQALGVSLGAGALARLLAAEPRSFERVVFYLPAVVDQPRPAAAKARLAGLVRATVAGDWEAVAAEVEREVPAELRDTAAARAFAVARTRNLLASGLGGSLIGLPELTAIEDRAALVEVSARALVIGCRGDLLHPVETAERLAESLPDATLHVYDEPHPLWRHRADLRQRISSFLNG